MATSRSEKLTQLAVVIIAVSAVAVSIWQGRISQKQLELTQEHNRLTVKPYLDITRFTDSDEGTLEVKISNQGYGPAIIKKFELEYGGQTFGNWNGVLEAANESDGIRFLNNYAPGSIMASNSEQLLVRLKTKFDNKNITIRIDFESIYKEADSIEFEF